MSGCVQQLLRTLIVFLPYFVFLVMLAVGAWQLRNER